MARTWQEIQELPEFQALDDKARENLRDKYFRFVVAPSVPTAELDAARASFDKDTAPPARNESFLGDIPDLLQRGALNAAGGAADFLGADTAADWLRGQGKAQERTMTPETVDALESPLFSEEGDYYLGEGATSPRAWLAQGLDTLGGMALPIPGGALARAALRPLLGMGRVAQGVKASAVASGMAERQAGQLARRVAPDWRDTAATVAGYGGMEGVVGAGMTEQQTREQVMAMPQAQLEQAPEYWDAMQATAGDPQAARQLLAESLGKEAGWKAFGPTVALGAGAGRYYERLLGGAGAGSRGANALRGAGTEALEEAPQNLAETLAQNTTLQQVDPTIGAFDEAIPNMLTGAALGGMVGGTIGALGPKGNLAAAEPPAPGGAVPPGTDAGGGSGPPGAAPGVPPGPPGAAVPGAGPVPPGAPPAGPLERAAAAGGQAQGAGLPVQPPASNGEFLRQSQEQAKQEAQARREAAKMAVETEKQRKAAFEAEQARLKAMGEAQRQGFDLTGGMGGAPEMAPIGGVAAAGTEQRAEDEWADRYAVTDEPQEVVGPLGPPPGRAGAVEGGQGAKTKTPPNRAPKPEDNVWADQPEDIQAVETAEGTGRVVLTPSRDGRWMLHQQIDANGVELTKKVFSRQGPFGTPVQAPAGPEVAPEAERQATKQHEKVPPEVISTGRYEEYGIDVKLSRTGKDEYLIETSDPNQPPKIISSGIGGIFLNNDILNVDGDFVPASKIIQVGTGNTASERTPFKPNPKQKSAIMQLVAEWIYQQQIGNHDKAEELQGTLIDYIYGKEPGQVTQPAPVQAPAAMPEAQAGPAVAPVPPSPPEAKAGPAVAPVPAAMPEAKAGPAVAPVPAAMPEAKAGPAVAPVPAAVPEAKAGPAVAPVPAAVPEAKAGEEPQGAPSDLVEVFDREARSYRVRQADLANPTRTKLPIYDAKGNRKLNTSLHRDNIEADPGGNVHIKTLAALKKGGFQIRQRVRSPEQEQALWANGFRPMLLDEKNEWKQAPLGIWSKPKQGAWNDLAPVRVPAEMAPEGQTAVAQGEEPQQVATEQVAPAQPRSMTALTDAEWSAIKKDAQYLDDVAFSIGELVDNDKTAMLNLATTLSKSGRDTLLMARHNINRDVAHSANNRLDTRQPRHLRAVDMQDALAEYPGLRHSIDEAKALAAKKTEQLKTPRAQGADTPAQANPPASAAATIVTPPASPTSEESPFDPSLGEDPKKKAKLLRAQAATLRKEAAAINKESGGRGAKGLVDINADGSYVPVAGRAAQSYRDLLRRAARATKLADELDPPKAATNVKLLIKAIKTQSFPGGSQNGMAITNIPPRTLARAGWAGVWFMPGQVQRAYAQQGAAPNPEVDELIFEGDIGLGGVNLIAEINQRLGFAPEAVPVVPGPAVAEPAETTTAEPKAEPEAAAEPAETTTAEPKAEPEATADDAPVAEPVTEPVVEAEVERLQRVQSLAGTIHRAALAKANVRLAALSVARGDEGKREILRDDLKQAIQQAIAEEMTRAVKEQDVATLRDLGELQSPGAGGLNPVHFPAEALEAWEADAVKQARRQVREERKAEYAQIISAAAAKAWRDTGFWQQDPDEMVQAMEREYLLGWQHALDGGTGSNLPPAERQTDNALRRQGYDAAVSWLGTEDGKAFASGAKARKMKGIGEQFRRRQDERKQRLAAIDLSQDDQVEAFIAAIEQETERAALFPLPEAGEDKATPGLRRYLADLRQQLIPFKEWALQTQGEVLRRYRKTPSEELVFLAKAGQSRREDLRSKADYYIDQVSGFAQVFNEAKTVLEAAQALHKWAHAEEDTPDNGSLISGMAQSVALKQIAGYPFKGTLPIMRNSRNAGAVIGTYLANGYRTDRYRKKENEPDETRRNQPLKRPRFDRVERIGEDYRQGRNITAAELTSTFGLKGVTYGNNVTAKQRQDHTNYTFDAFMDLARLLGIEPRHIGMGGKLTFAFGALGHGRHSAHYTPDNNGQGQAINLTNTQGDGAVAHEWIHALDWNLRPEVAGGPENQSTAIKDMVALLSYTIPSQDYIEKLTDSFLSGSSQWTNMGRGATPRDHAALYLKRTIYDLESVVERATGRDRWAGASPTLYKQRADQLGPDYWGNAAELLARAGEAWVYDRLEGANNYLVSDWVEDGKAARPTHRGQPYPSGDERSFFNAAFDQLFKQIEWTDAGPVLKAGGTFYEVVTLEGDVYVTSENRQAAEDYMARKIENGVLAKEEVLIRESRREGWRDSPIKAKARDSIKRAEELQAGLTERERELKARIAAKQQAETAQAEAEVERNRQEEEQRIRREWEALQAERAPSPVVAASADGLLSAEELSALFDEVQAELEEENQEAARGSEESAAAPPAAEAAMVDDPNANVIALARRLVQRGWQTPMTWRELGALADEVFGGTKAEGKYTPKDAYDAMEMALNLTVMDNPSPELFRAVGRLLQVSYGPAVQEALATIEALDNQVPTQTNRTAEQDEFQQFSTPHAHAALMARVAAINGQDVVLEPSAGSGNLATLATLSGPQAVVMNELSPRRAAILRALNMGQVYTENAEQISNILGPRGLKPTVVIMNPPFSATAGRATGQRDNRVGAKHVEEALKLLAPGGRAVLLMGRGYTRGGARLAPHWTWLLKNYNVRANLGLDGSQYRKFGTSFDNRLVVIDNTGPTPNPDAILGGEGLRVAEALELLENIRNDRTHVGDRYGAESGGGQVATAGSLRLPDAAGPAAPAATGPVGARQSGPVGAVGTGTGGDGGPTAVPGTGGRQGTRNGGAAPGRGRRPRGDTATGATGANAGGRGQPAAGATLLPGGATDAGLDAAGQASLSHAAAEFAKHGVEGINEALTGLAKLFGGAGLARSFPGGFDEQTYKAAKPHFEAAANAFLAAGNDFKQFFRVLLNAFGPVIKPYAVQFADEWQKRVPVAAPPADDTPANEPVEPPTEAAAAPKVLGESIYDAYAPNPSWEKQGAKPHPSALVESAAMAAVDPPELTVKLNFPPEVYRDGRLSAAQLDVVAYAEQAFEHILSSGERQGFFVGDGTGVGKGREIAGILYHNWLQGRRKALWLSANNELFKDSLEYLQAVTGGDKLGLYNLGGVAAQGAIQATEGVAFVTYSLLRSAGQGKKDASGRKITEGKKRIDQIAEWLGADFDGVIAFDEAHNMGNALETRGLRGKSQPSQVALLGVELQRRLPMARVVYVSATGATEATNLGYLSRLGLWGAGTPFANVMAFVNNVAGSGLATMEVVAKDMKAMGVYLARSLPFHEVSYAQLEHALSADQREMYDTVASAWQVVLQNINQALEATEQEKSGKARGAVMAQFWGSQQRFFNQMLSSLQMPSMVKSIEEDLAAGRAPILQFVTTNEASQEREAAKIAAEGRDMEELDITPRQVLLQFLENGFPVNQYESYKDENGATQARPVVDSQGNPVQNLAAVAARDALMDRVAQIRFPENPIDIVVSHFGGNQVAEITGRKRRFVRDNKTGKVTEERRNDALRAREVDEFQGDKRRILIFSDKGGTGKSYHADLNVKNQRKRVHYVVQAGWRADKAVQGLGRSHRTNQAQAPHVVLVMTNLGGHRRFVSSIARRMDQMGALTKGNRKTGGQGLFTEDMNLESVYATRALEVLVGDVMNGRVDGVTRETLTEAMGLVVEQESGRNQRMTGVPTIQQFLNKILVLEVDRQNRLFEAFIERMAAQVEQARAAGTLDMGLETVRADKVRVVSEREVFNHPRTGAKTRLVELELTDAIDHWTFDAFMEWAMGSGKTPFFMRNRRSGRVWAFTPGPDITQDDGRVIPHWRRWGTEAFWGTLDSRAEIGDPAQPGRYPISDKWEHVVDLAAVSEAWAAAYAVAPKEKVRKEYWLSGVLLPIWDRLTDAGTVRVLRTMTDEGQVVLGRSIASSSVDKILRRLTGSSRTDGMTPAAIFDAVLNQRATAILANNWRLSPRLIAGNLRIELAGNIDYSAGKLLEEQGVIFERIAYTGRYFIPTDPAQGAAVLARVLDNRPVIELVGADGQATDAETRFRREGGEPMGMSLAAVEEAVERQMAPWANAPEVVVFDGWDDPVIPGRVRAAYNESEARRLADDQEAQPLVVNAFWSGGKVYVNAAAVKDQADLEQTVRHEVLGHAGLRALFGPELVPILDRLIGARRAEVVAKAKALGLDSTNRQELRQAAEELLADLAMTQPELGFVRQLLAMIRAKLREWGVLNAERISDAEILREWVIPARNFIERGREAAAGGVNLAPAFQREADARGNEIMDSDSRFRLTDPADDGGSPLGGGRVWLESVGQALRDGMKGKLEPALAVLTLRQLADVGAKWVPLVKLFDRQRLRMETRRNVMMEEAGRLGDAVDAWARHKSHREEAQRVWDLANAATLAQADPSDYQVLQVPLQLGPGPLMVRSWAATMENVKELRRRVRAWKKSPKVRERELAGYYQQAAEQLFQAVKAERKRQAALPELMRQWEALSSGRQHLGADGQPFATEAEARAALQTRRWPSGVVAVAEAVPGGWALQELGGQQVFTRFRDLYAKRSQEMMEALIARLESLESLDEDDKRVVAAKIRAEFEATFDEKGNPRVGPYFPLQRWGRFFVFARRYADPQQRIYYQDDGSAFASAAAARAALKGMPQLRGANVKVVEAAGGWVLKDVGEEGFWTAEAIGERRKLVAELEAEGWEVLHQGLTAAAHRVLEGVSEGFMAEAIDKLRKKKATEEADTLYQLYLQTLQQMSIRKHFLHRKGTTGFTRDHLRAFGWNMTRLAHQISKLEGLPALEQTLRRMKEELKEQVRTNPGMDTTREDILLEELKRRLDWIANPTNAPVTNWLSALSFVFYLGVSPAAALVNLTQLPIVALPVLAGRLRRWNQSAGRPGGAAAGGVWGEAGRALSTAFFDVARGFKPGVIRGFVTGRPLPSEAANLTEAERAAFAVWDETGARDRTQAHNLAGIGDADNWLNGPTFNRVMGAVSSLFHLAEVVNRDATLLAGYRLARSRGMAHESAVLLAEDATWEAHYDYSNANRARFMQGDVAKVLLQFKNFAQHTLFFLGRNLYLWAKGEDEAVRREARTKFAGMVGMTSLFAGAAGLPIGGAFVVANALQAMFGDDDEPWDAETEWRNLLAKTFPGVVADVIDRGAVNTATGLDFASRVSIGDLLWRSPDRDLDGAGMFQHIVEQMLGPMGGIAARPFTMLDEVREGHWSRAAEAVVPKFMRDMIQAGRFGAEGVLTRQGDPIMQPGELNSWELWWKANGFTPDDLAVKYDSNKSIKLYERRIMDRRRALLTATALALMAKDAEAIQAARRQVAVYNRAHPEYKIEEATIRRSIKARQQMRERAEDGIIVNPKLSYLRSQAGGYGQ